mgnify:CR=1 FL=1
MVIILQFKENLNSQIYINYLSMSYEIHRQNLSFFSLNQFPDHRYKVGSKYHLVP